MSLPSKKQQIDAVAKFLDSDFQEGKSLEEVAKAIVEGYHSLLTSGLKKPALILRPGVLIKDPVSASVRRVQWSDGVRLWLVSESSPYGWLGAFSAPFWDYCEEYRPKRRIQVDGKGKLVEMTDQEIEEEWSNPDWKPGDKVSQFQRKHSFEVVASSPASVLLKNERGELVADGVKSLEKYYRREDAVSRQEGPDCPAPRREGGVEDSW